MYTFYILTSIIFTFTFYIDEVTSSGTKRLATVVCRVCVTGDCVTISKGPATRRGHCWCLPVLHNPCSPAGGEDFRGAPEHSGRLTGHRERSTVSLSLCQHNPSRGQGLTLPNCLGPEAHITIPTRKFKAQRILWLYRWTMDFIIRIKKWQVRLLSPIAVSS